MARDDELSNRIRAALTHVPKVTEKRMFGSIAFAVRGRTLIKQVDPEVVEEWKCPVRSQKRPKSA